MKNIVLVSLIAILLLMGACGNENTSSNINENIENDSNNETEESIKVIMTHEVAINHPKHEKMEEFANLIKEKSNGRLVPEIYPSGQLYTDPDVITAMGTGSVHIAWPPSALLETINEEIGVLGLPFAFDDNVMLNNSEYRKDINEFLSSLLAEQNIRNLGLLRASGGVYIFTKNRVQSVDDFKGLKISVAGGQTQISVMENLKANGIVMPISETPTALSQGTIDGVNTSPSVWVTSIGEIGKYGTVIPGLIPQNYAMIVDNLWLNSLPQDLQDIIIETADEMTLDYWQFSIDNDLKQLEKVKSFATVDEFSEDELNKVKEMVRPTVEDFKQKFPDAFKKFSELNKKHGLDGSIIQN